VGHVITILLAPEADFVYRPLRCSTHPPPAAPARIRSRGSPSMPASRTSRARWPHKPATLAAVDPIGRRERRCGADRGGHPRRLMAGYVHVQLAAVAP
jgi:hypothetical protein